MLRFRPDLAGTDQDARKKNSNVSQQRWRLWMLLVALGLVLATMRQLNKPNTARRLGQIFGADAEISTQQYSERPMVLDSADAHENSIIATAPTVPSTKSPKANDSASDLLTQVRDNTYFRPAETKAWFRMFERLQQTDEGQLSEATLGELTYAQLLKQPQVYRGQVVTLRGTVRLEESIEAPENELDIKSYHRLWISPRGGGPSLFVVYCLELPSDFPRSFPRSFPRGEKLRSTISVTGHFFKNWSYASQGGLAIAPVVLARGIDWQPTVSQPARRTVSSEGLSKTLLVACAIAAVVVWLIIRNTRRPQRISPPAKSITFPKESNVETIQEQLQKLAETEQDA